jgi:hypothetical protein
VLSGSSSSSSSSGRRQRPGTAEPRSCSVTLGRRRRCRAHRRLGRGGNRRSVIDVVPDFARQGVRSAGTDRLEHGGGGADGSRGRDGIGARGRWCAQHLRGGEGRHGPVPPRPLASSNASGPRHQRLPLPGATFPSSSTPSRACRYKPNLRTGTNTAGSGGSAGNGGSAFRAC